MKMISKIVLMLILAIAIPASAASVVDSDIATLRKAPLTEEKTPPTMAKVKDGDVVDIRTYPMQPPLIPHKVDGYQVDKNVNRCMTCHGRTKTSTSTAPMVSVTHYMDRDDNFLIGISPRRYFCEQCHVVQKDATPLVENDFVDMDLLQEPETDEQGQN